MFVTTLLVGATVIIVSAVVGSNLLGSSGIDVYSVLSTTVIFVIISSCSCCWMIESAVELLFPLDDAMLHKSNDATLSTPNTA